jgi:formylglycine-generating enzyme required for sulfatase activity
MKFLICILVTGCLMTGLAQPNLSIAPGGNQSILFWPTTATNYVLQSTTNLAAPSWAVNSNVVLVDIRNAIPMTAFTLTNSSSANFFRLWQNTNTPITMADGMALIPAGSFIMGDTLDGETDAIPISVTVSAFYMDTNLVSLSQWQFVYNWATNNGFGFVHSGAGKAVNYPVETVDWYDAVVWSNARSEQAGLTPVYYTDGNLTQVYTNDDTKNVFANWAANGYRLPTEAEWEKAARGGLTGQRYPWGDIVSESLANYHSVAGDDYDLGPNGYNTVGEIGGTPYTTPVGYFTANGYGIYDMAGNVNEWCWDWYGTPYGQPTNINPTGPGAGTNRVLRAGDCDFSTSSQVRCADRNSTGRAPTYIYYDVGFRCVRGL